MSYDCYTVWQHHKDNLDKLYGLALRGLSVPASSAPVERIFSHGGVVVRPIGLKRTQSCDNIIFLSFNILNKYT